MRTCGRCFITIRRVCTSQLSGCSPTEMLMCRPPMKTGGLPGSSHCRLGEPGCSATREPTPPPSAMTATRLCVRIMGVRR